MGAPQKRFAWGIGLALSILMLWLVVINGVVGPLNLLICLLCLTLLLFESAFGICLGCNLYNLFHKEKAQLCPGGVCEIRQKQPIQEVTLLHIGLVLVFLGMLIGTRQVLQEKTTGQSAVVTPEANFSSEDCQVPEWAKKMGHEEQYMLHHGCS